MGVLGSSRKAEGSTANLEATLTIIAPGTKVVGEVTSSGVVKVEGEVKGTVRAERQVLVAKGGVIDGDVITRDAVIGGEVRGGVVADERIEVQANAQVHGDITTQRLVVEEGGEVNGTVRMGTTTPAQESKPLKTA